MCCIKASSETKSCKSLFVCSYNSRNSVIFLFSPSLLLNYLSSPKYSQWVVSICDYPAESFILISKLFTACEPTLGKAAGGTLILSWCDRIMHIFLIFFLNLFGNLLDFRRHLSFVHQYFVNRSKSLRVGSILFEIK